MKHILVFIDGIKHQDWNYCIVSMTVLYVKNKTKISKIT